MKSRAIKRNEIKGDATLSNVMNFNQVKEKQMT
jgi:hypothetical protein